MYAAFGTDYSVNAAPTLASAETAARDASAMAMLANAQLVALIDLEKKAADALVAAQAFAAAKAGTILQNTANVGVVNATAALIAARTAVATQATVVAKYQAAAVTANALLASLKATSTAQTTAATASLAQATSSATVSATMTGSSQPTAAAVAAAQAAQAAADAAAAAAAKAKADAIAAANAATEAAARQAAIDKAAAYAQQQSQDIAPGARPPVPPPVDSTAMTRMGDGDAQILAQAREAAELRARQEAESASWWSKQTNITKFGIVGGSIGLMGLVAFAVLRKKAKS